MVSLTKDQKIQIWNLLTMGRIFQRRYMLGWEFTLIYRWSLEIGVFRY